MGGGWSGTQGTKGSRLRQKAEAEHDSKNTGGEQHAKVTVEPPSTVPLPHVRSPPQHHVELAARGQGGGGHLDADVQLAG